MGAASQAGAAARLAVATAAVLALAWPVAAQSPDESAPDAFLGARGPTAGDVIVSLGAGLWINAPYATAALRVGAGADTYVELAWEAPALLGQSLTLSAGWGAPVAPELDLGVLLETGIATMGLAGDVFGIRWRSFDLYNDWTGAAGLALTYRPARGARVSCRLALDLTFADYVFSTFDEADYVLDFGVRGPSARVQGEWPLGSARHLFLRLDAEVPVHAEVTPIGFLPTVSAGMAWSL